MRVLITGGAGFVGSHLTESFLADGHSVTVLDNFATGTRTNLPVEHDSLTIFEQDVTEPIHGKPSYDIICHLASIPTPSAYMDEPIQTLQTGATATRRTLELTVECDATYLFTSTSEVYGDPEVHPQPEDYNGDVDPYGPRSCYDEGKRYGEALVRAYREEHGLDVRIARIFNTYGPRMRDDRVIPAFVRHALAGEPLTIHGDGSQTRSFCYIDDLVRGLRLLLQSECRTPINLGNNDEMTISSLADVIRMIANPGGQITHTERPPDDPERRKPDISKAKRILDWTPTVELQDGIRKTIQARQSK